MSRQSRKSTVTNPANQPPAHRHAPPPHTPGAGKPAAGKPKPTAVTKDEGKSVSMRITGGAGGFDAGDDGSYALDRWVTNIPGTDDTARLQIEMSIALGKDERVRCREWLPDPISAQLIICRKTVHPQRQTQTRTHTQPEWGR